MKILAKSEALLLMIVFMTASFGRLSLLRI
jgi:hypothetical protein